jgi:hypothetical protein
MKKRATGKNLPRQKFILKYLQILLKNKIYNKFIESYTFYKNFDKNHQE